ncbi:nucleotide exchange factor GrpE [Prevotella sp.]|uniref:nucleotide exchange factor GrpE n=1 Tax=Prevotella sp. TaxID=59823 RepID=UPI002F923B9A
MTAEKNIINDDELQNDSQQQDLEGQETYNSEDTSVKADNKDEAVEDTSDSSKSELVVLQEENAQLKDQLLRKIAEFDNYRKRTVKEKTELILNGGEKAICSILPILDDFERALSDKSDDPNAIREGVEMIFNKFNKALESLGVKKIDTEGVDFNVDYHEAIAMVPGMGDDKKGKVIDCVQSGYTMNDKVIRHAKVAVGQ